MSLDVRRCAELLAIRERTTRSVKVNLHHATLYSELDAVLPDGNARSIGRFYLKEDADFYSRAHDLADQLRDALELLREAKAIFDCTPVDEMYEAEACLHNKLMDAGI